MSETPDTPTSAVLATPQHRLGAKLLDEMFSLLISVIGMSIGLFLLGISKPTTTQTLLALTFPYLAWWIWMFYCWKSGQTPAKKILKLRVLDTTTGHPASWKLMGLREFLVPNTVGAFFALLEFINGKNTNTGQLILLSFFGLAVTDALWIFRGGERRRLLDHVCKTVVLNEAA